MFQKFFTDTIESKFIKALLKNSPIPVYPSIPIDGFAINGCVYTTKYGIVRSTKTGKLYSNFIRLYPYSFGQFFPSFTEKYVSKYNYYDTATHEMLGDYLRIYRDLFGVDLMPFYNCFSYRFFEDFYLTKSNESGYVVGENKNFKIASIPIKFDKTYTIAVDCSSALLLKAVFHDGIGFLTDGVSGNTTYATDLLNDCPVTITFNGNSESTNSVGAIEIPYSAFNNTVKFKIGLDTNLLTDSYKRKIKNMEKYLYLSIQLPSNNESSIVVLEGDYTNNDKNINYYNIENINDAVNNILFNGSNYITSNIALSEYSDSFNTVIRLMDKSDSNTVNNFMHTDLSLLEIGTTYSYAFSNRLVEYLLLNVVDKEDTVDDNTIKAQKAFKLFNFVDTMPGVWDNRLRFSLYKKFVSENSANDINGFIDKDVEKMLVKMDGDY